MPPRLAVPLVLTARALSTARPLFAACTLLTTCTLLAACGGASSGHSRPKAPTGLASDPPATILRLSAQALGRARTVHVHGTFRDNGVPTAIDLHLVTGRGGEGTITQDGRTVHAVVLGDTVYLDAGEAFWRHYAGIVAPLLSGHWLKLPATGQVKPLAQLTNVQAFYAQILAAHGILRTGRVTTLGGRTVVPVIDTTKGGTLYVAATGPPYPLEITGNASRPGTVVFDAYNEPVSLAPPSGAVGLPGL